MGMNLSKLQEMVEDGEAWHTPVRAVESQTQPSESTATTNSPL